MTTTTNNPDAYTAMRETIKALQPKIARLEDVLNDPEKMAALNDEGKIRVRQNRDRLVALLADIMRAYPATSEQ